jgi:hypothetical protein
MGIIKFLLLNQAAWIGLGKLALDVPLALIPKLGFKFSKTNSIIINNSLRALNNKIKVNKVVITKK